MRHQPIAKTTIHFFLANSRRRGESSKIVRAEDQFKALLEHTKGTHCTFFPFQPDRKRKQHYRPVLINSHSLTLFLFSFLLFFVPTTTQFHHYSVPHRQKKGLFNAVYSDLFFFYLTFFTCGIYSTARIVIYVIKYKTIICLWKK